MKRKKTFSYTVTQDCRKCINYNGVFCKVYGFNPDTARRKCMADRLVNFKQGKA